MALIDNKLPRVQRVRSVKDFRTLFKSARVSTMGAKLFFAPNGLPYNRLALTLPHGYGNAVKRNRSKRVSRAAYRSLKTHLKTGYDFLVMIYPTGGDDCNTRKKQLTALFKKAGVLATPLATDKAPKNK